MTRTSTAVAGALSALICLPSAGRAEDVSSTTFSFGTICSSGAIKTCASVTVTTTPLPGGGTQAVIRVANMQGMAGLDNTDGSLITKIGLTAPDLTGAQLAGVAGVDGAIVVGTPSGYWTLQTSPGTGNIGGTGLEFTAGTQNVEGGILGCDPSNANPTNYFQTCGSGAVEIRFTTTNSWTAASAQLAFKSQSIGPQDLSLNCRTGDGTCIPSTTVPEPATLVLLGTGLTAAGLLRRRRRAAKE